MKNRRGLAWTLAATALLLSAVAVGFYVAGRNVPLPANIFGFRGSAVLLSVEFAVTGAILATRRPENRIGWLFLIGSVAAGVEALGDAYAIWRVAGHGSTSLLARIAAVSDDWVWLIAFGSLLLALALFPDGRAISRGWGRWIAVCTTGTLVASAAFAFSDRPAIFPGVDNPVGFRGMYDLGSLGTILFIALLVTAFASLVVRLRRSTGEEREQMKWVAYAAAIVVAAFTGYLLSYAVAGGSNAGAVGNVMESLVLLGAATIPIAIGIGILKYRLYDIDVVIRKTVVFAIAVVLLMAVFVVGAVVIGALVSRSDTGVRIAAAFVVGLLFEPARRLATRIADRAVFGGRATPYEVLTEFTRRAGAAYEADDVLDRIAQVAAAGVGASGARVWVRIGDALHPDASAGTVPDAAPTPIEAGALPALPDDHAEPVFHRGELLGAIGVDMPANDPMTPDKARLIADLAAQAGAIVANVRLIEELRESRRRIVSAQDERARKLERDIHDGAQQQLVALAVKQRLLIGMIGSDDSKARTVANDLVEETNEALENLRDLARGIYPPLLADKGLPAALEAQARRSTVPVSVTADGVARYAQDVEAAVYFSCLEALQNVAKYANASSATIRLSQTDGHLDFEIADDGDGFDPGATGPGSGLRGMADRLAAVGGEVSVRSTPGNGTTVAGRLPVGGGS
ncbi:MAG TPA: ATP-binding protein [Actinomycetota bacterium]|nr:ATP-binding protein [Actinomycetota bacterium]